MTSNQKKLKREDKKTIRQRDWPWIIFVFFLVILTAVSIFIIYFYQQHFWPKTAINGFDISNLSLTEAIEKTQGSSVPNFTLALNYLAMDEPLVAIKTNLDNSLSQANAGNDLSQSLPENKIRVSQASSSAELAANYDFQSSLTKALQQQQNWTGAKILHQFLFGEKTPHDIWPEIDLDDAKMADFLAQFNQKIQAESEPAKLELKRSGQAESLTFTQGKNGLNLDKEQTLKQIKTALEVKSQSGAYQVDAVVQIDQQKLTKDEENHWLTQANKLVGEEITWQTAAIDNFIFSLDDQELITMLTTEGKIDANLLLTAINDLATEINRPPVNPVFEYNAETLVVNKFSPPVMGLELDVATTYDQAQTALNCLLGPSLAENEVWASKTTNDETEAVTIIDQEKNAVKNSVPEEKDCQTNFELTMTETEPQTPLAATNNLGIKEEIGFGESYYYHSIAGRVANVALAGSRLNLALIAPGQEFSFNRQLGDISAASGYKNGYIIQGGRSVLAPGGGVCQVSSTLFRALLDSGVKITLRLPHAYRVSYYELSNDPGFDATVYAGNVDLRFVNDTAGYILIYVETDTANSYMSVRLYGTSDGRTTEIVDYQTYGASRAPAAQYIDDPSLPRGAVKQIDFAVGGMKVKYTNVIRDTSGNVMRKDDYFSNYQPWSAKYLVGTG